MISASDLGTEISQLAQAIGLFKSDGSLDVSWFDHPLDRLGQILSDNDQRTAFLQLLHALFPPKNPAGLPSGENWHPLLGSQPRGNLYVTVGPSADNGTLFGVAGNLNSTDAGPRAALQIALPIIDASTSVQLVAGGTNGPLTLDLRVVLKDLLTSAEISLNAIHVTAEVIFSPSPTGNISITLEQLQLGASAPKDYTLGSQDLGAEATQLVFGLIQGELSLIGAGSGEAAAIAQNLLPLLGLTGGIPPFPFASLVSDPLAVRNWFASLAQGNNPVIGMWIGKLVGLLGAAGAGVSGSGTETDPWTIPLVAIGSAANSGYLSITAAVSGTHTPTLELGLDAKMVPGDASPPTRIEAQAVIVAIPLAGGGAVGVLPSASVSVVAPGDSSAPPLGNATISLQSIRGGLSWDGSGIKPQLELDNVTFQGSTYPRIDLTNADSVAAALGDVVKNALGTGAGAHLAALVGIIPPAGAPAGWPAVNVAGLVGNPPQAIAQFHRTVLVSAEWEYLLGELGKLLGLTVPNPVPGTGTASDPWRVPLVAAGGNVMLEVVAWNGQTSGVAGDPQKLRLGIRATTERAPVSLEWISELLAFDLPASGSGQVTLFAGQHAIFALSPIPSIPSVAGVSLFADGLQAEMDWSAGSGITWQGQVNNLSLLLGATEISVPALKFPPAPGFDISNPTAVAAGLGVSVTDLESFLLGMLGRAAFSWGGNAGAALAGLLGIHAGLPGFQRDWPTLTDPAGPGSLFSDPFTAARNWLSAIALNTSIEGTPFLFSALAWLNAFLGDALPDAPDVLPPTFDLPLTGSGTYDDPWALPLIAGTPPAAEALAWLDSAAGMAVPPAGWAADLLAQVGAIADSATLVNLITQLGPFLPAVRNSLKVFDSATLAACVDALAAHLSTSDGVVPQTSQVPTGGQWTAAATATTFAHHMLPHDPAAISQILSQADTWAATTGGNHVVLLIGPSFGSAADWSNLLASPSLHGTTNPAAYFNLRASGVDSTTIDLSSVTVVADYYTADLQDDGSGNLASLTAQIGNIINRLAVLRPGQTVTIVAHSTAGVPARVYTAANPTNVQGLITLGTPHGGAPLPFLTDLRTGEGLRFSKSFLPATLPTDPLPSALSHLFAAIEGYAPNTTPGSLPTASPYPASSFNFNGGASSDTGGRPALAIGGVLTAKLLDFLSSNATTLANAAANPNPAPAPPTHIGFGLRAHLNLPAPASGDVSVDASVRADIFRVALSQAAPQPAHSAQSLRIRSQLVRVNGWLVGGPSAFGGFGLPQADVRVGWAELGVDIAPGASGLTVTPQVVLHDASYHGPVISLTSFTDAQAQALVGAVLQTITATAPSPASGLGLWLGWMQSLNVVVPNSHGGMGISADAWNAITASAGTFLSSGLSAALASGSFAGFTGAANGPWSVALSGLPLEIYVSSSPWTAGIRTTPAGTGSIPLATNTKLGFDASVALAGFTPKLDASFSIGAFTVAFASATKQLTVSAQPWLAPLQLVPKPSAATLTATLNNTLPRLLFSGAASALLESIVGVDFPVGPLDSMFSAPTQALGSASSFGDANGGLDPSAISALLQAINGFIGSGTGNAWVLPGGLHLSASGSNTVADPTTLTLATTSRLGGVLDLGVSMAFDQHLHVTPGGTIALTVSPLPGGTWTSVAVNFGVSPSGVTLSVTPQPGSTIQLLPTVSGLSSLAAGITALLPSALDAILPANPAAGSALLQAVLDVCTALQIYDGAGHFSAHTAQLQALLRTDWTNALSLNSSAQQQVATALANLFNGAAGSFFPVTATTSGGQITLQYNLPAGSTGTIAVTAGWDSSGPAVTIAVQKLKLTSGAVTGALTGAAELTISPSSADVLQFLVSLGLDLSAIGLGVTPEFSLGYASGQLQAALLPLATPANNGPLAINLAPTPGVVIGANLDEVLAGELLVPLAGDLILRCTGGLLTNPLWPGGPTAKQILTTAQLLDGAGNLAQPLPNIATMVGGVLSALATGLNVTIGTMTISAATEGSLLGLKTSGKITIPLSGSIELDLLFGAPAAWGTSMNPPAATDSGLAFYLLDISSGISFHPRLDFIGVGFGLSGADDAPLVNTSDFRMQAADLYLFFSWDFPVSDTPQSFGAGAELTQVGLPLSAVTGGQVGGNPVASSLLQSGSGSPGGNSPQVNPGVDVGAFYWSGPLGDDQFHISFSGQTGPLWIPIHAAFGPIYIDQLGIGLTSDPGVSILIDGSVQVAGFTAQADGLGVTIPFHALSSPGQWSLDLQGLGIGFEAPGITLAGGLLKTDGPPVEYDGMLVIRISQFGFVAVGAYSTPTDPSGDQYTSLFVFLAAFIVIGLPPIIEIDGFGLGIGYNRELIVPDDLNQIPSFVLVAAMDGGDEFANDPMGELMKIRTQIPAKRGSFWLAVGLNGSSFVIVHVIAIVYVALDSGVDVGVLGIARMALPSEDAALACLELALKARFSSAEGVFSVQAQLTDNSYLLSPDCQLTGGFAYFMWFLQSQFVLSVGGYNPHFNKPSEFPDVPLVGYRWSLLGIINIKGGVYFALTNSCVMAGGSYEASYGPDWIQVWFSCYGDFLASWDPFYFEADVGVSVGATFSIQACAWGVCVGVDISVSIGATLILEGPPLHGELSVDLEIGSVTIAFGPEPNPNKSLITDWSVFRQKYVYGGDPNGYGVAMHALTGILAPAPPGAQPGAGTSDKPWQMATEFSFQSESKMPAGQWNDFLSVPGSAAHVPSWQHALDVAPMGFENIVSTHAVALNYWNAPSNSWKQALGSAMMNAPGIAITAVAGQASEATWHYIDPTQVPAAANTIPALTGVLIVGTALFQNPTQAIPIGTLVNDGYPRTLPFAQPVDLTHLQFLGAAADALQSLVASVGTGSVSVAASQLLSGSGYFAQARTSTGASAAGLSAVASRALLYGRSSPPRLASIATGLTMKPVGLAAPPAVIRVAPVPPIPLTTPRLRAVLQANTSPSADAPAAMSTTVSKVAPANAVRVAAPTLLATPGASLQRIRAANAPRPTAISNLGRTLGHSDFGAVISTAQQRAFDQASLDLQESGVAVPSGATHLWDIPTAAGYSLHVSGDAVRVTFLTRGGTVLSDTEILAGSGQVVPLPAKCAMVAVTCLGSAGAWPGASASLNGFGVLSFAAAPSGFLPVAGWQAGNLFAQVASTTFLGRGCTAFLSQHSTISRSQRRTSQAMVMLGNVMSDQSAVETWLPASTTVLMLFLDQTDPTTAGDGDFQIAAKGCMLDTPPQRVLGGARKALLYDVLTHDPNMQYISISAASNTGWKISGIVGATGLAQEWAARMNGGIPDHLVSNGAITPDGQVVVRLAASGGMS